MSTERIFGSEDELGLDIGEDFVATIEIRRPPNNYISLGLVDALAEALGVLDEEDRCRAIVLCASGKHFCAGGDFSEGGAQSSPTGGEARNVYDEADRLFANTKPIVAAIQGAAIGAGLGLSLVADFRVAAPEADSPPTSPASDSITASCCPPPCPEPSASKGRWSCCTPVVASPARRRC